MMHMQTAQLGALGVRVSWMRPRGGVVPRDQRAVNNGVLTGRLAP